MSGNKEKSAIWKIMREYALLGLIFVLAFLIIFPIAQYCRGFSVVRDEGNPKTKVYKWENAFHGATVSGVIEDGFNCREFQYTTYADGISLDDIREAEGCDAEDNIVIEEMLYHRFPKYQMIIWDLLVWASHFILTYLLAKVLACLVVLIDSLAKRLSHRKR